MNYLGAFRPVFAYAAHLAQSSGSADRQTAGAREETNVLLRLLEAARRCRREPVDPNFDQAWFALAVWLNRALARLPGASAVCGHIPEADGDPEPDFFRRLELLLTPLPGGFPKEILEIIKVYAICLELDCGTDGKPGKNARSREYLRRCRRALAAATSASAGKHVPRRRFRPTAGAAAAWLLPAAAPLLLYILYRYLLDNLYLGVVG